MDNTAADGETLLETVVFLNYFNDMSDPRVRGAKPRARRSWVPQAGRSYRQRSATFGVAATQAGRSRALT